MVIIVFLRYLVGVVWELCIGLSVLMVSMSVRLCLSFYCRVLMLWRFGSVFCWSVRFWCDCSIWVLYSFLMVECCGMVFCILLWSWLMVNCLMIMLRIVCWCLRSVWSFFCKFVLLLILCIVIWLCIVILNLVICLLWRMRMVEFRWNCLILVLLSLLIVMMLIWCVLVVFSCWCLCMLFLSNCLVNWFL